MTKARDLANAGTALTTVSATELGYLDGVTSAVQTQLNAKQAVVSGVNDTEIGYLDGVTSAVQTQLDAKIAKSLATAKGDLLVATGSGTVVAQAVGTNGQVLTADSAQADGVKWATPSGALNWIPRSIGVNFNVSTMAYNGSNLYVIAGAAGNLYTSPDLVTWTFRESNFNGNEITKVIYANSLWVAVGVLGNISTSTDGITWTSRTSNFTGTIRDIYYGAGYFVAAGDNGGATNTGGIVYSTNGTTWTRVNMTPSIGPQYYCVVYNGTNWIVGADSLTNNYLYASNPTGTWTAAASNQASSIAALFTDGTNTYLIYGGQGALYINASATMTAGQEAGMGVTISAATFSAGAGGLNAQNAISIYSGTIHALGNYYQTFSTTFNGTVPATISPLSVAPPTIATNASPFIAAPSRRGVLATSLGVVIWGTAGRIWTSF